MNNFFNFTIPYFNSQFGEDWDSFNSITEENVDYIMDKTWQLYWLKRIDTLPVMALDYAIKLRGIEVDADDTVALCLEGLTASAMPIYTVGALVKSDFPISIESLMEIIYLNPAR